MEILQQLLPLILIIVVFYFLLILPQKKAAKARQEMLGNIKAGDKVETVSREIGIVVSVSGDELVLNIGASSAVEIKIHKEGVARVMNDSALNTGDKAA